MNVTTRALLTDGRQVRIRSARPEDEDELVALHRGLSERSLYLRFFTANPAAGSTYVRRLLRAGDTFGHAVVAELDGRIVGLASYQILDRPTVAEAALVVADDLQSHGVGTLLLEHLVSRARERGIEVFQAEVLAQNTQMIKVFADAGLEQRVRRDGSTLTADISLGYSERYLTAVAAREARADAASLARLLAPATVAVIGASRRPGSVGNAVFRRLLGSFSGRVYPVNPRADAVAGHRAYASVGELPTVPDLAVVAVPAPGVPAVAEQCGVAGVPALLVLTAGLSRTDADSPGRQLVDIVHRYGMRLVGPNCIGVANTDDGVRLDATFLARPVPAGEVGIVTQSGGVGIALVETLAAAGLGCSTFVSTGDKYDVSSNDLLMWWSTDDRTRVALVYVESFGNPRKFSRLARRLAATTPVIAVRAAAGPTAQRAARSHTAATATPAVTRDALFRQAGVIAADDLQEAITTAALLSRSPAPAGHRLGVISNAGGAGVLAADAAARHGLVLPDLDGSTSAGLGDLLPSTATLANPVDTTAGVDVASFGAAAELLAADPWLDVIMIVIAPTALGDLTEAIDRVAAAAAKPVVAVVLGQPEAVVVRGATPVYHDPATAARAIGHAARYADWLRRPVGSLPALAGIDRAAATAAVEAYLHDRPDGGWSDWSTTKVIATAYGLPVIPSAVATDPDQAVEAWRFCDGPVALKALTESIIHRTDTGGVALALADEAAVRSAYRTMAERYGSELTGVAVQPMTDGELELLVGVVQDEVFGPLVQVGAGGVTTDVVADRSARLLPLTDQDIREMLTGLRCWPLLTGFRGAPPLDIAAVEEVVARVARLAAELPQVAELDLNPILVRPDGVRAVDLKIRIAPAAPTDPYLRHLR